MRRHLAASLLLAAGASPLSAQSLLEFQGRVLATDGDAVPGLSGGEVFAGRSAFDHGVLDGTVRALFRAQFSGGSTSGIDDRAYFYGSSREDLQLFLRSGDLEPSGTIPGATLNTASGTGLSSAPRINPNGTAFFGASLYDGNVNVNSSNDTAIYVGTPGSFSILVREGDPAPGTVGATFSSSFSSPSQQLTAFNAAGIVLFKSNLAGGDVVGTTNNEAWYTGFQGNLVLAVRKGDLGPNGEIVSRIAPGFISQLNAPGQILYDVEYQIGSGNPPVTDRDDRALWIYTQGQGNQELMREGDAAPLTGVTFNKVGSASWFFNTGSTTFNTNGEALLRLDLDGNVVANVDDSAIVLASVGGHQIVARRGDLAPGLGPNDTLEVFHNSTLQLANNGRIAFKSTLAGPNVTTADDEVLVTGGVGNLQIVAREGDIAPGSGGGTFGNFFSYSMIMNGVDQILFQTPILGGTFPGSAYYAWDAVLGLQPIAFVGDSLEVQPGVFKTVSSTGNIQFSNGDSRPLGLANDGTCVLRVTFSDGTNAIVTVRIGTLSAAPREVSASAGGSASLYLNAGLAHANRTYLVLGSVTGTSPGFFVGNVLVPLNPDPFFLLTVQFPNLGPFSNTLGTLDAMGRARAELIVPPGAPGAGLALDWAGLVFDPSLNLVFASRTARISIRP